MKKILILGAKGDLAKAIYKNIDKVNNSIYKLEKKNIDFLNSNSQKKLFLFIKRIKPTANGGRGFFLNPFKP